MKGPATAVADDGDQEEIHRSHGGGEPAELEELIASIGADGDAFTGVDFSDVLADINAALDAVRAEGDPLAGVDFDSILADLDAALDAVRAEGDPLAGVDFDGIRADINASLDVIRADGDPLAGLDAAGIFAGIEAALEPFGEGTADTGATEVVIRGPDLPPPDPHLTAADAAAWMRDEVDREGSLNQAEAAYHIRDYFGERFTYINENGNLAISREVLRAFLRLTRRSVVWEWQGFRWRLRMPGDPPRRRVE